MLSAMAFRSELDSARDRADAAEAEVKRLEAELASNRERMDRIQEVESQLEAARAAARTRRDEPTKTLPVLVAGLLVGLVASFGVVTFYGGAAGTEARHALEECERNLETTERDAEDRLAAAGESARQAELSLDDERHARDLEHRELGAIFAALATDGSGHPMPLHFGTVRVATGPTPVAMGARCNLEGSNEGGCLGALECGGVVVHRFGCVIAGTTSFDAHNGMIRVRGPLDWQLSISTLMPAPEPASPPPAPSVPVSPAPRPPPMRFPPGER
jgi:hypothetical protein